MRPERMIKIGVNIGVCLFFLLILYVFNDTDDYEMYGPNRARDDALDNYDYYMDDIEKEITEDNLVLFEDEGLNNNDDILDDTFLHKGANDRNTMEEIIVVVVAASDGPPQIEDKQENAQTLEAPEAGDSDNDDLDVLRDTDVIIDNMIIDQSEDIVNKVDNDTSDFDSLLQIGESDATSAYYSSLDLLPYLKKPPSERDAPGEFGHPFVIPKRMGPSVERQIQQGYKKHHFNVLVSDIISLHRNLGDKREDVCKTKEFRKPLPSVSVIICYRNEAASTLLRTIYSVLESVPGLLLNEVIVVDDASYRDVFDAVNAEIEEVGLQDVVKVIRNNEQVGIAKARMVGADLATGDVLTFLDSHCECYEGWMEPLLERIKEDRHVVALSVMEIINPDNFKFSVTTLQRVQRGGFDWTLTYRWLPPPRERFQNPKMDMTKPIPTPTMSGGVFAIEKKYFYELGKYDRGMEIYGSENLEMSFRVWTCGGSIEILPCSHVGHVFKSQTSNEVSKDVILRNKRRVAEIWMDDYKNIFYRKLPEANLMQGATGNITDRQELRKKLECKPFKWYVENVYPELYIPELNPIFSGAVCCRIGSSTDVCLDTLSPEAAPGRPVSIDAYQKKLPTQYFEFTKMNELRQTSIRDLCLANNNNKFEVQKCKFPLENRKGAPPSQQWIIHENGSIESVENGLCVTASTAKVWLAKCDNTIHQIWRWE